MATAVRFHHGDESWLFTELTGNEVIDLERVIGTNYMRWDLTSAKVTLSVLASFLARTHSQDEVGTIIEKMTFPDIVNCWDVEDEDLPTEFVDGIPLGEAATEGSTTGSSSAEKPSAGLPALPEPSPSGT